MSRVFLRFPSAAARNAAAFALADRAASSALYLPRVDERLLLTELTPEEIGFARDEGLGVFNDVRFDHFGGPGFLDPRPDSGRYWDGPATGVAAPPAAPAKSLKDVLEHVRAPQAWTKSRGAGTTIAIIDTGVCASLAEFPVSKRSPVDLPTAYAGQHWHDPKGHGSMCATIAAGSSAHGGRYDGIAPEATVLAARTTLWAGDIYRIYDELVARLRTGEISTPLVISNSYGLYTCDPPATLPRDHPYMGIVEDAIDAGATVAFAAGNNHVDVCQNSPGDCQPNTIWAVNSHDRVLSVGTIDGDDRNDDPSSPHVNSSRGPGQWASAHPKPDCVAPTYGEVVWGCGYAAMDWWGTSGACPQVAGLAALLLSLQPSLTPAQVSQVIRDTCVGLDQAATCVGAGRIDCRAAVEAL